MDLCDPLSTIKMRSELRELYRKNSKATSFFCKLLLGVGQSLGRDAALTDQRDFFVREVRRRLPLVDLRPPQLNLGQLEEVFEGADANLEGLHALKAG